MKNTTLFFMLLFFANQLFAQYQNDYIREDYKLLSTVTLVNDAMKTTYVEGSPYTTQDKSMGEFYLKNKGIVKTPTRINYYYSSFEFDDNNETHVVSQASLDSVIYEGSVYFFRTFAINGISHIRVVKVLGRQNKNALYVFTGVNLLPEVKASGYVEPKPPRYQWTPQVYLYELGDRLIVLNNFKSLTSAFPGKENEINAFIKKNKIRKNSPDGLISLLGYISQLSN